jgi:2-dehydropantoate 2-reductase
MLNMKSTDLSFLVIGAGAVGGITAALLKKNGYDVEIIAKYEEYSSLISEQGICVSGVCGSHTVRVPSWPGISGVRNRKDVILHATKANDLAASALEAMPFLKSTGIMVSMQNGICEEELIAIAGNGRVAGCVTGWGATMEERGRMAMTSGGDFILGYPDRDPDELLHLVAEALSCIAPARVTGNILGHKYSKLVINSCITSLGAVCGLYLGEMLRIRKVRNIFIEIIREAVATAEKNNIRMEIFAGRLDFRKFVADPGFTGDLKRHIMIRIIGFRYRRLKSSSLQSLERGKPAETDWLNGYIARKGSEQNVDVTVNKAVADIIHEIEAGKRPISVSNFDEYVFDRFD